MNPQELQEKFKKDIEKIAKLLGGIDHKCITPKYTASNKIVFGVFDNTIGKISLDLWKHNYSLEFWFCNFSESIVTDGGVNTKLKFQNCTFEKSWFSKLGCFKKEVEFIECNFLQSIDFTKSTFEEKMCFYRSNINGQVFFTETHFLYKTIQNFIDKEWIYDYEYCFKQNVFAKSVDFNRATFDASVDFSISKFEGEARFLKANFYGKNSEKHGVANCFKECIFEKKAIFDGASFSEKVDFGISRFEDEASFVGVKFDANPTKDNIMENNFEGSIFYEKTSFEKAKFQGRVDFRNSRFKDEARFLNVNFLAPIVSTTYNTFENNFSGITFDKTTIFSGSKFYGKVKFSTTRFNDEAKFVGVDFLGMVPNKPHNNFAENDFAECVFEKSVAFDQNIFNGRINFALSSINNALFSKVHFQKKCKDEEWFIPSTSFKNTTFINCFFSESVKFVQCDFIDCNFLLGTIANNEKIGFEKVIFTSSIFKGTNNFDDGIFHQKPALTNNIFDGEFKINQDLLKYSYRILEKIIGGRVVSNQSEKNPSIWRDLFRQLKSNRLAHHNVIEASELHTQELYARELELSQKGQEIRDKIEKWQLWFYRLTSDHHTDLAKIFNNVIMLIALFGIFAFGLLDFSAYPQPTDSKTPFNFIFGKISLLPKSLAWIILGICLGIWGLSKLSKCRLFKVLKIKLPKKFLKIRLSEWVCYGFLAFCCGVIAFNVLSPLLLSIITFYKLSIPSLKEVFLIFGICLSFVIGYLGLIRYSDKGLILIAYLICGGILIFKPSLLLPFVGQLFDEGLKANFPAMQSLSVVYCILMFLMLFSLQKTARKNSIIPS